MLNSSELKKDLKQFTGTTQYYKHWTGLKYTDGIKYVVDNTNAYWLLDAIFSYRSKTRIFPFQIWSLKVKDTEAVLTMKEDCDLPVKIKQEIEYTDFPEGDWDFWFLKRRVIPAERILNVERIIMKDMTDYIEITPLNLTPELHGCKVLVIVHGKTFDKVALSYYNNSWFICQDFMIGNTCEEKFGYAYSYQILGNWADAKYGDFWDKMRVFRLNNKINNFKYRQRLENV